MPFVMSEQALPVSTDSSLLSPSRQEVQQKSFSAEDFLRPLLEAAHRGRILLLLHQDFYFFHALHQFDLMLSSHTN